MDKILTGLIVKAISGFYYVETAEMLYECKARGIFRLTKFSPERIRLSALLLPILTGCLSYHLLQSRHRIQ